MKKLIAIVLALTLMFSFMAMPVSAKLGNVGESDPSYVESATISIFGKIGNFFHNLIAKIFSAFGADCPLCDNHYGYGAAEGEGGYTKEEVAKMYNEAINTLKKYNKEVRIDYAKEITAEVIEGAATALLRNKVNAAIKEIKGRVESGKTYTYNSQAAINNLIAPAGKDATLSGANVSNISVNRINDTTKIQFTLNDVDAFYDGTTTTGDGVYASILKPINFATLDVGTEIVVKNANILYRNVKVELVIDSYGRPISFTSITDYTVSVEAKASSTNFSTSVAGQIVEAFEAKYVL